MTFSFFFFHCSKFFNFVFLDLSSSWWRGQWYPRTCHGFLFDCACWDGPWTSKSEKGSSTFCILVWRPLSFPPKQNENPHCWLQASGASHTWYVIGGGAGETMYSTVEHRDHMTCKWIGWQHCRGQHLVAILPRLRSGLRSRFLVANALLLSTQQ
jgi:hypothetical protein